MKPKIPALTRSNLHRLLRRHGLNTLPKEKKKFKNYEIGYFHIDITEVIIANKKKLYIFIAVDRISKYVYLEIHNNKRMKTAVEFLKILTDNGFQFTYELLAKHLRPKHEHSFDVVCNTNAIEHRLTSFAHPWTNGQVKVFNRVLKDYTTKDFYYESEEEIKRHVMGFLLLYNFQRPFRSLKYANLVEYIRERFREKPELFHEDSNQKIWGLNTS